MLSQWKNFGEFWKWSDLVGRFNDRWGMVVWALQFEFGEPLSLGAHPKDIFNGEEVRLATIVHMLAGLQDHERTSAQ